MVELPAELIGQAYRDSPGWSVLEDLVDLGDRMAGHDGERAGTALLRDYFEEIGLHNPAVTEFEIPGWWRESSTLSVGDRTYANQHQVIALPASPDASVTGELVDLGHGLRDDIESRDLTGQIAMVRSDSPPGEPYVHRMVKYSAAVEAGAVGVIYGNHIEGCLPPTGDIGYHDKPGPIPAVGISAELAARLARQCKNEAPRTELTTRCRNEPTTSANVHGDIGPDEELILVTAHVDAHDIAEGASDNGVGCALVAATATLLAEEADRVDTGIRFLCFGAEEVGLYGAYHAAETIDADRIKCVFNIDGAGGSRNPRLVSNKFESVVEAVEAATDRLDIPLQVDDDIGPHADDWAFCERGIPAVRLGSVTEGDGRGWGHTHADTLDKVDPRDFRELTIIVAASVLELASVSRDFSRVSPDQIRAELDENDELELRVGDRWNFEER